MFSDERLRSMLASAGEEPTPSAEFLDDLWSVLARERRRTLSAPRRFPLPLAAALAALLLALTVGLLLLIGSRPPSPPILRGLAGSVGVDGPTDLLLAHEGTLIVGWPGVMGRIDTQNTSLPGTVAPSRAVAAGPAGWWAAGTQLQRWIPSGPSGWAPAPGPTIEVLAWEIAVGETEIVALLATGEYVVFDVRSGARKAVLAADGTAELAAGRTGSMGIGGGTAWVLTAGNEPSDLRRFDIASGQERGSAVRVDFDASMAIGTDGAWVADATANRVVRFDPATGAVSFAIDVGFVPEAISIDSAGFVWVVGWSGVEGSEVTLGWIDPAARAQQFQTYDLADDLPVLTDVRSARKALAVTDDAAWVGLVGTNTDFDPGDLITVPIRSSIVRVAVDR